MNSGELKVNVPLASMESDVDDDDDDLATVGAPPPPQGAAGRLRAGKTFFQLNPALYINTLSVPEPYVLIGGRGGNSPLEFHLAQLEYRATPTIMPKNNAMTTSNIPN